MTKKWVEQFQLTLPCTQREAVYIVYYLLKIWTFLKMNVNVSYGWQRLMLVSIVVVPAVFVWFVVSSTKNDENSEYDESKQKTNSKSHDDVKCCAALICRQSDSLVFFTCSMKGNDVMRKKIRSVSKRQIDWGLFTPKSKPRFLRWKMNFVILPDVFLIEILRSWIKLIYSLSQKLRWIWSTSE